MSPLETHIKKLETNQNIKIKKQIPDSQNTLEKERKETIFVCCWPSRNRISTRQSIRKITKHSNKHSFNYPTISHTRHRSSHPLPHSSRTNTLPSNPNPIPASIHIPLERKSHPLFHCLIPTLINRWLPYRYWSTTFLACNRQMVRTICRNKQSHKSNTTIHSFPIILSSTYSIKGYLKFI